MSTSNRLPLGTATAWPSPARGAEHVAPVHPGTSGSRPIEIERLATYRGETVEQFSARFVRQVGDRTA